MTPAQQRERIVSRLIESEMRESFLDYSMSVIVQRALPDVRDGLKPVHRRILVAMHGLGLRPDRDHRKCATVVGEVLGKYHPHGDAAVYDALVRMVQDFSLRYPLVDGQGNFGSLDGDAAAAYRYTEARLSAAAAEMLADIEKETVRWENNFDDRLEEPTVLPSRIPNLLVNGSAGIAVGMSTNVPPHNLGEVAGALRVLAENPDCTVADLMEALPGPDFPTGAFIARAEGLREMYETGRGRITMRARVVTEAVRGGRRQLVVTELPYATSKARIVNQIAGLKRKGGLADVTGLRDESDRDGVRLVIELKRGADAGRIVQALLKKTALQSTFGAILLALDGGAQPREFTLKELLERFRDHRLAIIQARARFDLEKAAAALHVTEGLLVALNHVDRVIELIRASENRAQAAERLQHEFGISEVQAGAILDLRLAKLTAMESEELRERKRTLQAEIDELQRLLGDESLQTATMLSEMDAVVEQFGDARRTEILYADDGDATLAAPGAADETVVATLTRRRYLKRIPLHLHTRRTAAGKALARMDRYEGDFMERAVVARTQDLLLLFTKSGKVWRLRVDDVPEASLASRGRSAYGLLEAPPRDPVVAVVPAEDLSGDRCLVFATRQGMVKRTRLRQYARLKAGGLAALTVRPGDEVLDVAAAGDEAELLFATRGGRAIRFPASQVSVSGRTAQGVKALGLRAGDYVIAMAALVRETTILAVTEDGTGKRIAIGDFPLQKRGGLGTRLLPERDAGRLAGALEALDDDGVMIVSAGGSAQWLAAGSLPVTRRNARGRPLMALDAGDHVVEIVRALPPDPAMRAPGMDDADTAAVASRERRADTAAATMVANREPRQETATAASREARQEAATAASSEARQETPMVENQEPSQDTSAATVSSRGRPETATETATSRESPRSAKTPGDLFANASKEG